VKAGNIPTAAIAEKLDMLIRDRWPHGNGLTILAEKLGCDESTIRIVLEQRHPGTSFDFVDRLFCALGRPMEDVGLGDVYWNVGFVETCALHSCGKTFPERFNGRTRKRYCSSRCSSLGNAVARGEATGDRLRLKGKCLKGHDMTPENTITKWRERDQKYEYQCRECKRTTQREWMRKKRRDKVFVQKKIAAQRKWRAKAAA
jgi:hypothetical protein